MFAMRQFKRGLGAAFLFEPRTGKTKTTIDTICALNIKYGTRKVLIVCPNRIMGVWVQEIAAHAPVPIQTIVWDAKARKNPIPRMDSAFDMQVLITNYETFSTPGRRTASGRRSKANGRFKHRQLIRKWIDDDIHAAAVLDEGHKIKSPSGSAANMIVTMRDDFRYRLHLTGTPITKAKRAADAYMQWLWINPDRFAHWPTHDDFRNGTGVWTTKADIPIWRRERPQGMAILERGIHADGMVVHRADCFDLPERLPDRIIPVKMTAATARAYDDMAAEMVAELESGDVAEARIPLTVTLRLSQITGGYVGIQEPHPTNEDKFISRAVPTDASPRYVPDKLRALRELFEEETIERDEAVIVCARFAADLNAIESLCTALELPRWSIRGGMTRSATDDALKAFKRTDGARVMVVQPSAGGMGLDMSAAPEMIWYSLIPSWVDFRQMMDRNALNQHGTRATFLICPDTVDQVLYDTLQEDGDVADTIMRHPRALLRSARRR